MNQTSDDTRPLHEEPCPSWCIRIHGKQRGEEDLIHLSHSLLVRRNLVRLCSTVDPETRAVDGPYLLIGEEEYTLHEAEVLLGALTQLLGEAADIPMQRVSEPAPLSGARRPGEAGTTSPAPRSRRRKG